MAIAEGLLLKAGDSFIKDIYGSLKNTAVKKWQSFDWYTAQIRYYQKIEKDYGTTRVLGKPEPISLEGIFTDVYVLDKPTAFHRFDIIQLQKESTEFKSKANRLSGLEMIQKGEINRLYILGKPGAGKTTFLKFIALKAAQNKINKIPIFVSLYDWAKSDLELIPFIVKQFDICSFPDAQPLIEYILDHGLAIVLFDGLDETKQEDGKRDKIIEEIRNFSRKYDSTQILLTCRIAATDYTFEEFTYVEVADFTKEQVEGYTRKWFSYDIEKYENFEAEFNRRENERLREMANTPLLLSLLCLTFEVTGTFPNRRVEIYEEGINALLSKWDSSRNIIRDEIYKGLSLGRKRQMFARIAAQTFEKNEYFIPKNKLINLITDYLSLLPNAPAKEDIDGETVLRAIEAQHSIFVERAKNIYSFSHLTFQEYFTSKYIVENTGNNSLKNLLHFNNLSDDRWREVILNTASLLDDATIFFEITLNTINSIVLNNNPLKSLLKWADLKAITFDKKSDFFKRIRILNINLKYDLSNFTRIHFDYLRTEDFNRSGKFDPVYDDLNSLINTLQMFKYRPVSIGYDFLPSMQIFSEDWENNFNLDEQLINILLIASDLSSKNVARENKAEENERRVKIYSVLKQLYPKLIEDIKVFNIEFFNDLLTVKFPSNVENLKDWEFFVEKLLLFSQKYRNLVYINKVSRNNYEKLFTYLTIAKLCIECLNLAVVSNRQNIEDLLLKPI